MSENEPSDRDLIFAFQKGDEKAFDALVNHHQVKAVQLAYVAVHNYEDAKDISQDAFVKVYRALKQFKSESAFSTWFYRILMNTAKDFLRRRKWKVFFVSREGGESDSFFETAADPHGSPGEMVIQQEIGTAVTNAVAALPFQQRWVFTLRMVEGLSLKETGCATGLAAGTVKSTLHFAVQKVKSAVSAHVTEGR